MEKTPTKNKKTPDADLSRLFPVANPRHKSNDGGLAPEASISGGLFASLRVPGRPCAKKTSPKKEMAERLKTSSAQVNCLLNPNHNPSLSSLSRAAAIVGRQVKLTLSQVDDQLVMGNH